MMADDAAAIINSASSRRSDIEVKGVERATRDPYRTVTVVLIGVPPCAAYPDGKKLWVHPRQVLGHLKLYPGAYVIKEKKRRMMHRKMHSPGVTPKGHVG